MSQIRSKETRPEIKFLKQLSGKVYPLGHRYRKHAKLIGKPDVSFSSKKVAVFIDGCFWHGCRRHWKQPLTNSSYWSMKVERNQKRDRSVSRAYKKMGWTALRFWEHEVKKDPSKAISRVLSFL